MEKEPAEHSRPTMNTLLVYISYWYLLGPAFGISIQLFINYRFGLISLARGITYPDVICISSCIILAAYIAISKPFEERLFEQKTIIASGLSGLAAILLMEVPLFANQPSPLVGLLASVLFSGFLMTQILLWLSVFAKHDNIIVLIYALASTALSISLSWFAIGLCGARLVCLLVVIILCSMGLLYVSIRKTTEIGAIHESEPNLRASAEKGLLGVTFFFGVGVMYTTCFVSLEDFHNTHDWTIAIYSTALMIAVFIFSHKIKITTLYYIATPITIFGILLALFSQQLVNLPKILTGVGFFTYLVFVIALYCALIRERNSKSVRSSCLLVLGLYLGLFTGRHLFSTTEILVTNGASTLLHAFVATAIVTMLIICAMIGIRVTSDVVTTELSRAQFDHVTSFGSNDFATRIASVYKLTSREAEVLNLLLKGKSVSEISEELFVANGTTKAHVNNIYKKLGIHSKEELFAMTPSLLR
mgnify:FL=1